MTEKPKEKDAQQERKPLKIFKEAEYHKPPDRDDNPPPPMPHSDEEASAED